MATMLEMQSGCEPRRGAKRMATILLLLGTLLGPGCAEHHTESGAPSAPMDDVLQERLEKDRAFRSGDNSPILEEERASFRGLVYYPVNPDLKFTVKLNRYPVPTRIHLATNTGEIRRGLRYGFFEFEVSGRKCRLQVYRLEEEPGSASMLFIPFRDSTSGQETYASGRYIDLAENTSGVYELDFNRAYNPYCAYNSAFSCPIPPAENTLALPIRAGEKKYLWK